MNAKSLLRCTACLARRGRYVHVPLLWHMPRRTYVTDRELMVPEKKKPITPTEEYIESHRSVLTKIFPPGSFASLEFLNWYQSEWDFSWRNLCRWYLKKQYQVLLEDQRFIEERHSKLGYDLAAAHFLLHRFGAVKFAHLPNWVAPGDPEVTSLPSLFDRKFRIEGVDVSGSQLTYEGLENLMQLRHLKWLNVSNCPHLDDFAMDQIAAEYGDTLEYLDISDCPSITEGGVAAITRLRNLKALRMQGLTGAKNVNLLCLMLADVNPALQIDAGVPFDDPALLDEGKTEYKFLDPPPRETPFLFIGDLQLDPFRLIMHKIDIHYEIEPNLPAHFMLGEWVPPGYENYVAPPNLMRLIASRVDERRIEVFGKLEDFAKLESGVERKVIAEKTSV